MGIVNAVTGKWTSGRDSGRPASVLDVRAGKIYARTGDDTWTSGRPDEFLADTGESGDSLMDILLRPPPESALFRGAIREALAESYSISSVGRQDTRAWDELDQYVIDDNEGSAGAVRFLEHACIAVISSHDASRVLDEAEATSAAPAELQEPLLHLSKLPLLVFGGRPRVTAVLWSEDGILRGGEPWHETYVSGGELFRRELLEEEAWKEEASEYYNLADGLAAMIVRIAERAIPRQATVLTAEEVAALIPSDSPHRSEGVEQLEAGGVFKMPERVQP